MGKVVSWPVDQLGPPTIGGLPAGPRGHAGYTPLVNYCQAPACSVPAGLVDGLPIGLQIVGPRYADARVLQFAAVVVGVGFMVFLPFLVIDLVVSSILMAMGMMMLPPVTISLPFKLIFFVLVDGWSLVAGSLVQSYGQ